MDYTRLILPLLFVISHTAAADAELGASESAQRQPSSAPWPLRRSKRCSCSSLMDKECVYFCHLDIIWINTPERIVPYGLGSPSRSRRSLEDLPLGRHGRCQCANLKDKKCTSFCETGKEHWTQSTTEKGWRNLHKDRGCKGLGLKCAFRQLANSKKMRRLDAIGNSIKASFNIAKLKSRLHKPKQMKHNRTYQKQNIWESLKTTS
ncbi:endothelin-1 [Podarcis muralis]|uniref:Endothelin-1 n=1 Tax=Podarcis lilfordi TaxID=74358 RepID=A0AA35PC90_9SAUR|nr:endothelinendothelin-1 [Podarcis lilfordi]